MYTQAMEMLKRTVRVPAAFVLAAMLAVVMPTARAAAAPGDAIYVAQLKLNSLGHDVGEPDGVIGARTRAGVAALAEEKGFEPTVDEMINFYIDRYYETSEMLEGADLAKVQKAMENVLRDPFSAKLRNVAMLPSGNICGQVNAKNSYGAYVGFTWFITTGFRSGFTTAESGLVVFNPILETPERSTVMYMCMLDYRSKEE